MTSARHASAAAEARSRISTAPWSGVTVLTCANGHPSGTAGFTVGAPGTSVKATT